MVCNLWFVIACVTGSQDTCVSLYYPLEHPQVQDLLQRTARIKDGHMETISNLLLQPILALKPFISSSRSAIDCPWDAICRLCCAIIDFKFLTSRSRASVPLVGGAIAGLVGVALPEPTPAALKVEMSFGWDWSACLLILSHDLAQAYLIKSTRVCTIFCSLLSLRQI